MSPLHDPNFSENVKLFQKKREKKGQNHREAEEQLRNPLYCSAMMGETGIAGKFPQTPMSLEREFSGWNGT